MDPRLLDHYNRELQHLREMGGEFAEEFPKIAGRLGLNAFECTDPYVERLLEGFAFLAARVRLKLDTQFAQLAEYLLEMVYPHYLAPVPSMAVTQFKPDAAEGALTGGFTVPRGTVLRGSLSKGEVTPCEYRTAHPVTLWPVEVASADYVGSQAGVIALDLGGAGRARAAIRLRLRTSAPAFHELALESLAIYLHGADAVPARLYEQLIGNAVGIAVRPIERPTPWLDRLGPKALRPMGFDPAEALLPAAPRSFDGYRLLQEYFALPQRYLFVALDGLGPSIRRAQGREIEVVILLNRADSTLDGTLDAGNFALFCTPAINLFPKRADRIHLDDQASQYHVVPDRTRALDYEVHSVLGVEGYGVGAEPEQEFLPFYACRDLGGERRQRAYYMVHRRPRVVSVKQRRTGPRSSYVPSETFVSLVDTDQGAFRADLHQLGISTLCTNRDLPLFLPAGKGATDFSLEIGAPVESVRCVAGPTRPRASFANGRAAWRLVSHLSLNYLSLADADEHQGALALRDLLGLYAPIAEATSAKQIEGIRSIASEPIVRRVPDDERVAFGRGRQVTLTCDEAAFEGSRVFLLGSVLEQFFSKYVSINAFTEMVLRTTDRGEVMRWPARIGRRQTL
jgi:type VI secretion system protein ImpG